MIEPSFFAQYLWWALLVYLLSRAIIHAYFHAKLDFVNRLQTMMKGQRHAEGE